MQKRPWKSNVKSLDNTTCYYLEGHKFREIVHKLNKNQLKERLKFLSLVPIFQSITNNQLNSIITSMLICTFDVGQIIFREGETGSILYIIKI